MNARKSRRSGLARALALRWIQTIDPRVTRHSRCHHAVWVYARTIGSETTTNTRAALTTTLRHHGSIRHHGAIEDRVVELGLMQGWRGEN